MWLPARASPFRIRDNVGPRGRTRATVSSEQLLYGLNGLSPGPRLRGEYRRRKKVSNGWRTERARSGETRNIVEGDGDTRVILDVVDNQDATTVVWKW